MPGKPPYFPFFVRDFASDGKVEAMTTEEVGAYILLLCKAWLEEPSGSIPSDDTVLARWARLDAVTWAKCRARVLSPFTLDAVSDRYVQKRMQEEYRKLMGLYHSRSDGGKKGAGKRWKKKDEPKMDGLAIGSPNGSPNGKSMAPGSGSDYGSESDSSSRGGGLGAGNASRGLAVDCLDPFFDRFWKAYPKKENEMGARREWDKIAPTKDETTALIQAVQQQKKARKRDVEFWPNADNWLANERWRDIIDPSNGQRGNLGRISRVEAPPGKYDKIGERIQVKASDFAPEPNGRSSAEPTANGDSDPAHPP